MNTNDKNYFANIYQGVENNITNALTDIDQIKIKNTKGNEHLNRLKDKLAEIKQQFSNEINFLKDNSEWEKFTIAFFGETNAGKSTILEALRIIFDEKARQEKIQNNSICAEEYEKKFSKKTEEMLLELKGAFHKYKNQTGNVASKISQLSSAYNNEYKKIKNQHSVLNEKYNTLNDKYKQLEINYKTLDEQFSCLSRKNRFFKILLTATVLILLISICIIIFHDFAFKI